MKRIERNLYLHENGTYYAIFDGVPRSLGTHKVSEAKRLLSDRRALRLAERATPAQVIPAPEAAVAPLGSGGPAAAGQNAPGLAELMGVVAQLSTQIAQQNALITELHAKQDKSAPEIPFEQFQNENLATICSTVAKDSQRMYRGTAKRLLRAVRVYRRYERMKQFAETGRGAEPDLWKVFRGLGPGGVWGFWRDRKQLDNSSLNQLRCYLNAFVEGACDQELLHERFLKLASKVNALPVAPDIPIIPSTEAMAAFFRACRSVNPACADLVELTAYTGQRPCNMKDIRWEDVDLRARMMRVAQDGVRPPVDLSSEAAELLERLKAGRINPTGPVIKLTDRLKKNALSVMKRCSKGLEQEYPDLRDMTNLKSLRHYFASTCVMAGVDFKTIALWLGHCDGGVLAAKTYGHLRRGHTKKQMGRVQFSCQEIQAAHENSTPAPKERRDVA